jgi:hypothetical protein
VDYRASLAQQQQAYVKTTGFYGWLGQHRRLWLWLTFISVALVIELPFLLNNQLFGGWDQQFHVNRIEELYRAAQQGMWHNEISTFTFRQAGLGALMLDLRTDFLLPCKLIA